MCIRDSIKFNATGTFYYHCALHDVDGMQGKVVVDVYKRQGMLVSKSDPGAVRILSMITPSEKPRDTSSMTSWFVIRDWSFWEPQREETSRDVQRRQRNPRPI